MIKKILLLVVLIMLTGCFDNNYIPPPSPQPIDTQPIIQNDTNSTQTYEPKIPLPHPGNLTAYFINVGQGDAIFIVSPDDKTLLIDAGPDGNVVADFIRNLGYGKIDYFITTHPHADHIGGAGIVQLKLRPTYTIDNGQSADTQTYKYYIQTRENYSVVSTDQLLNFGNTTTELLVTYDDGGGFSKNINDNSIVVRITYQNISFLFTGDCELDCEMRLASQSNITANILKAGHHGSNTSTSFFLLKQVKPNKVIISVGQNSYGHPSEETIQRITYSGAEVYRTDQRGSITVTTDGWGFGVV